MSHLRMGAVAAQGVRNARKGGPTRKRPTRQRATATPKVPDAPKANGRNHSCSVTCSCRLRQAWSPYVIRRTPLTVHKTDGVTWAKGGDVIRTDDGEPELFDNVPALQALANALTAITTGRRPMPIGHNVLVRLPDDVRKRAMYGYSTSDPIVMPAETRTKTFKPGVVISRKVLPNGEMGEPIAAVHDRRMTADENRAGNVVYRDVSTWSRKWHRKGTARPFQPGGHKTIPTGTRT